MRSGDLECGDLSPLWEPVVTQRTMTATSGSLLKRRQVAALHIHKKKDERASTLVPGSVTKQVSGISSSGLKL
jgi:hypothetical protein